MKAGVMRRNLLSIITLVATIGAAGAVSAQQRSADSFIVPGIDFTKTTLDAGAWCRYVVIDEALGEVDTTDVYIGIPEQENSPYGPAYWVEIESHLRGSGPDGREVMRMLVTEEITGLAEGDSLGSFVLKLYIKSGSNPPQEENPKTYRDFSLVTPTSDSSWTIIEGVSQATAAGDFECTLKERSTTNDREFKTGNITLIKKASDDYSVWFCDDVPVFRLVRCEIDRVRRTETKPHIGGMPTPGDQTSRTTAELVEYGFDAAPLLSIGYLSHSDD